MKKLKKTNALRILDSNKIDYSLIHYEVDESNLSGTEVAKKIGIPQNQIFKTLVLRCKDNSIIVACIEVGHTLDLKKIAKCANQKSVEMVNMSALLELTGYIRGGVSPVGMKKKYKTFFDNNIMKNDIVSVSAGVRGTQMLLAPKDLANLVDAQLCDLI